MSTTPTFTRMLNTERDRRVDTSVCVCVCVSVCVCQYPPTQPQPSQPTQVPPGQGGQRAPVLHPGEVEDERNAGDEDEVEDSHGGQEVGHFP